MTPPRLRASRIFHAGTVSKGRRPSSPMGGRVLNVWRNGVRRCWRPSSVPTRRFDSIKWPDGFCRRDIAWQAVGSGEGRRADARSAKRDQQPATANASCPASLQPACRADRGCQKHAADGLRHLGCRKMPATNSVRNIAERTEAQRERHGRMAHPGASRMVNNVISPLCPDNFLHCHSERLRHLP